MRRSEAAGGVGGGSGAERAGGMRVGRELLASGVGCGQEASLAKGTATPVQYSLQFALRFLKVLHDITSVLLLSAPLPSSPLGAAQALGGSRRAVPVLSRLPGCLAPGRTRPFSRARRGAALVTVLWLLTAPQL